MMSKISGKTLFLADILGREREGVQRTRRVICVCVCVCFCVGMVLGRVETQKRERETNKKPSLKRSCLTCAPPLGGGHAVYYRG